jgi:RNA polymerase sigma-70 factor (ECF subfamily)
MENEKTTPRPLLADVQSFEAFYSLYYEKLYQSGLRFLKKPDLVEDAVQELFMKLWDKRLEISNLDCAEAYLCTSLRNLILNKIRGERRAILRHLERQKLEPESDCGTENAILLGDYQAVLEKQLRQLSTQKRKIFEMKNKEGLSSQDVASQLGISVNTVKVQYHAAVKLLRSKLGKAFWE